MRDLSLSILKSGKAQNSGKQYLWAKRIAIGVMGAAVFAGGLSIGNLVGATETEPIILEPAQMPLVDNDFCLEAPVTCAPFLPDDLDEPIQPVFAIIPADYVI